MYGHHETLTATYAIKNRMQSLVGAEKGRIKVNTDTNHPLCLYPWSKDLTNPVIVKQVANKMFGTHGVLFDTLESGQDMLLGLIGKNISKEDLSVLSNVVDMCEDHASYASTAGENFIKRIEEKFPI